MRIGKIKVNHYINYAVIGLLTLVFGGISLAGGRLDGSTLFLLEKLAIKTYELPEGATITSREQYLFVQNYNEHPVAVTLPGKYCNMENGEIYQGQIPLKPLDIVVICPA